MKKNKITVILILIVVLLLNSTPLCGLGAQNTDDQTTKVLSKNEEALQKKIDEAKNWLKAQKPFWDKWFTDSMFKFRQEMERIYTSITKKIEEYRERHYTPMKRETGEEYITPI